LGPRASRAAEDPSLRDAASAPLGQCSSPTSTSQSSPSVARSSSPEYVDLANDTDSTSVGDAVAQDESMIVSGRTFCPSRNNSDIWTRFWVSCDSKRSSAVCLACHSVLAYTGSSTKNLRDHESTRSCKTHAQFLRSSQALSLAMRGKASSVRTSQAWTQDHVDAIIVKMYLANGWALRTVDSTPWLRELVNVCSAGEFTVMSRPTLRKRMIKFSVDVRSTVSAARDIRV
jgi:hypothetical protein